VSRDTRPFVVFGFNSTHDALDAEAVLADMGVDVVPVPAPAALSARCGIALRVPSDEADRARLYFARIEINPTSEAEIADI